MKKLSALVLLVLFAVSCSSSDSDATSNPTNTDSILLRRTIQTTSGSTDGAYINDFTYNGNKLNTITSNNGLIEKYFYTGDLITRMEWTVDNSGIPIVYVYSYNNNGQLVNMTKTDNLVDQEFRIAYSYNSDGTITLNQYSRTDNSPEEFDNQNKYYMNGNNDIERIEDYNPSGTQITQTTTFVYDTKNSPFKNILGWSKLLFATGGSHTNVTSMVSSIEGTQTSTYQYNINDFPIARSRSYSWNPGVTDTFEYIYE
ncbi:hypothetical protein [Flavobacterium sp.]|uniref:hypothetical protein n=1 Tax=Flavobacterium sp. TaxID=239 RepID=UPI00286AEFF1|nr:hypothetical protein [Flavobacterium sp.]